MFRKLSPEEEKDFRKWARDNYLPGSAINAVWHPVVRHECEQMNIERTNGGEDEGQ